MLETLFNFFRSTRQAAEVVLKYVKCYSEDAEGKTLQKLSSGIFIMRDNFPHPGVRSFLLLKLPTRFDIPKGISSFLKPLLMNMNVFVLI